MSYSFLDGAGVLRTAESSIVNGTDQRQVVTVGSTLTALPVTFSGNITIGSILSTNVANQSVSGTVVMGGGQSSVSGVGVFNTNHIGNGSIFAVLRDSSVSGVGLFNVNHVGNGSILTVSLGSIATAPSPGSVSGVGLFNVNHTGIGSVFTGFRNDLVASTVGVNLTSRLVATDSAGRMLIKPFSAEETRVGSVITTNSPTSTSLLAAGGAGLRTYITDAFVTNTSSTATLVTFQDGDNSVMGRTIAPATGGSNMVGLATPMKTGGFAQIVSVTMSPATSTLGVTALGYYAP